MLRRSRSSQILIKLLIKIFLIKIVFSHKNKYLIRKGVALLREPKYIIEVDDYLGNLSQQKFVFKTQIHCFKNNIRIINNLYF